jgi:hypothetical protein
MNFSPWYSTSRKYRGTMSLIAGSAPNASYTSRSAFSGPPLRFFQMVPGPAGAKQSGCPDSWNHEFCLFFRTMSLAGAVRSRAFWKKKHINSALMGPTHLYEFFLKSYVTQAFRNFLHCVMLLLLPIHKVHSS